MDGVVEAASFSATPIIIHANAGYVRLAVQKFTTKALEQIHIERKDAAELLLIQL